MLSFSQSEVEKILFAALERREADGLDDPKTVRLILRKLFAQAAPSRQVEHFIAEPVKHLALSTRLHDLPLHNEDTKTTPTGDNVDLKGIM